MAYAKQSWHAKVAELFPETTAVWLSQSLLTLGLIVIGNFGMNVALYEGRG
jgi:hypothetical protein